MKTLHDMNEMDPYDFPEGGYRCTVTIGCLVPNVSWWFASCTKCSKSCVQDGSGYICNPCSSNSFRFKYKLCFIVLDGTEEAEMVCFGDVGRHIVGKPVQQDIPPIAPPNVDGEPSGDASPMAQDMLIVANSGYNDQLQLTPSNAALLSASNATLPPSLTSTGTQLVKDPPLKKPGTGERPSASKRLFTDGEDDE